MAAEAFFAERAEEATGAAVIGVPFHFDGSDVGFDDPGDDIDAVSTDGEGIFFTNLKKKKFFDPAAEQKKQARGGSRSFFGGRKASSRASSERPSPVISLG